MAHIGLKVERERETQGKRLETTVSTWDRAMASSCSLEVARSASPDPWPTGLSVRQ